VMKSADKGQTDRVGRRVRDDVAEVAPMLDVNRGEHGPVIRVLSSHQGTEELTIKKYTPPESPMSTPGWSHTTRRSCSSCTTASAA
jgi:hypothetical protein